MHLVSLGRGKLATGCDPFHALQACLNVGTLTGAPKLKAMTLLRQHEATRRGPYGGAIGWVSGTGEMDSAVIIRSAVVRDGQAWVRARSEEHTSELQSLMRISYAVFCLKKKTNKLH